MRTPASALPARLARTRTSVLAAPSGERLDVVLAERPALRLIGFAGLGAAPPAGLLIPRCRSVHTWGMRFHIDVVFVHWPPADDGSAEVIGVRAEVPPRRFAISSRRAGRARSVAALELAAGRARALGLGSAEAAVTVL